MNVSLFAWALASRFDVREAMTMTFVSLVLIQFCKAYSFRSERHSVLRGTFANRWLNGAVLWELALLDSSSICRSSRPHSARSRCRWWIG